MSKEFKDLCIDSIAPLALSLWNLGWVKIDENRESSFTKFFGFFQTVDEDFLNDISNIFQYFKEIDDIVKTFSAYYRGVQSNDNKKKELKAYLSKYENLPELKMLSESIETIEKIEIMEYHDKCLFP